MNEQIETNLGQKLRSTGLPEHADLADKFDAATSGYYAEPQTVTAAQFLGAFARARKAWCAHSGEPLV